MSRLQLRDILKEYFNEEDLREICFELDIDYESIRGDTKDAKARELILYVLKHCRIAELLAAGERARPHVTWPPVQSFKKEPVPPVVNLPIQPLAVTHLAEKPPVNQVYQVMLDFTKTERGARITWQSAGLENINTVFKTPDAFRASNLPLEAV